MLSELNMSQHNKEFLEIQDEKEYAETEYERYINQSQAELQ